MPHTQHIQKTATILFIADHFARAYPGGLTDEQIALVYPYQFVPSATTTTLHQFCYRLAHADTPTGALLTATDHPDYVTRCFRLTDAGKAYLEAHRKEIPPRAVNSILHAVMDDRWQARSSIRKRHTHDPTSKSAER